MTEQDQLKQAAAEAAMVFLPMSGVIGLGTGSTALHAIRLIGQHAASRELTAVATSKATAQAAAAAGIPLLDESGPWEIDVTFDGADEVDPLLNLIKGGGGALLREKIVAAASRLNVIMVDESKLVERLGVGFRLPVEVTPFGWRETTRKVAGVAGPAVLRERNGVPFVTDNGNYVLDVDAGGVPDPAGLEKALETIPGVVVCGLFVQRADRVVVARRDGTEVLSRAAEAP